jgi:hypothetical protein
MKVAGDTAILGGVSDPDSDHTKTVRYNAFRHDPAMEFGDPYIPKSVLGDPCSLRLEDLIIQFKDAFVSLLNGHGWVPLIMTVSILGMTPAERMTF